MQLHHTVSATTDRLLAEIRARHPPVEMTDEQLELEADIGRNYASENEEEVYTNVDSEEQELFLRETENLRRSKEMAAPLWEQESIGLPSRPAPISSSRPVNQDETILEKVQHKHIDNREYMSRKYDKKRTVDEFEKGELVALKIPKEARCSTDNLRLFCIVIDRLHRNSYELRCRHGIINCLYPTKALERVPESITKTIDIPSATKKISLTKAAELESTSTRVGARTACQCKGQCGKRCRCIKQKTYCSSRCHRNHRNCGNLVPASLIALDLSSPAPSQPVSSRLTSSLSDPTTSSSSSSKSPATSPARPTRTTKRQRANTIGDTITVAIPTRKL